MSISRTVGHCTIFGLVVYLFIKGALVMRPRETIAALSALIAALVNGCCGSDSTRAGKDHEARASVVVITSAEHGSPLEERRQRDLVGNRQCRERREGDVDPAILDHAQVLGVQTGKFGGALLGQPTLFTKLPKPQAETALGTLDGLLEGRTKPDFRRSMISRETLASSHTMGLREVGLVLHKTCLESSSPVS